MSFTSGPTATSTYLVFGPSRLDVQWDGVSNGKISVLPVCSDTATTASYQVSVLHVFDSAATKTVYAGGLTSAYSATAGEPFRTSDSPNTRIAAPFQIGSTLSTASGVLSFELIPGNTNYTNTFDTVSVAYPTTKPAYYKLEIQQTKGTATQVIASGKLSRITPNPFSSISIYGSLVQAQTASFCIG